ncbi:MAG TPA: extracellular solute-binding protein [Thermoanaerobaculia bacterium]|nr:extracellular solute-binding protein [Thermoanaerobaculia bacterium]
MLLFACADTSQKRSVSVLYAGSLATVMENGVGPAFSAATGYEYKGEAHGSLGAARLIHDHLRSPDVFISADPSVNENVLMGSKNGDLVTWFATLASSQLVLAYNPKSHFAASFEATAAGKTPWYEILETPGVRFGRGDPTIDPKGYRTLFLFTLAGKHYQRPEIPGLLGDPLNPAQVLPEVALLARIESGQFDAGIFYKHEIVAHELPFVSFPPEINLGDSRFSSLYAQATYITPTGEHVHGAPILFTLTIPKAAHNQAGAKAFVRFLLTSPSLLEKFGFGIVEHQVGGDSKQIPADLRSLCSGTYKS